jgi:hypothetical protein
MGKKMAKAEEDDGVKILVIQISEGLEPSIGPNGEIVGSTSLGNAITVRYAIYNKTVIVKQGLYQVLENDMSEDMKNAMNSITDTIKSEIEKQSGI